MVKSLFFLARYFFDGGFGPLSMRVRWTFEKNRTCTPFLGSGYAGLGGKKRLASTFRLCVPASLMEGWRRPGCAPSESSASFQEEHSKHGDNAVRADHRLRLPAVKRALAAILTAV